MSDITQQLVRDWFDGTVGPFSLDYAMRDLHIRLEDRPHLRVIFHRLVKEGLAEPVKTKGEGWYRRVESELDEINIFAHYEFYDMLWPFDLEKYVRVSPRSVTVVAGEKSAGKTLFLLRLALLNSYDHEVHFFNSESSGALLKERLLAMDSTLTTPLPFRIYSRMYNFEDVVKPDALNIIDYLMEEEEAYKTAAKIRRVLDKLHDGIAVIGLQKPPGERDFGYGGYQTMSAPELYLALRRNSLKIVTAKSRANGKVNPVNMQWTFLYDEKGAQFINPVRDTGEDTDVPEKGTGSRWQDELF